MSKKRETAAAVVEDKEVRPGPLMYVGPTMTRHGLIQNTVYAAIPETAEGILSDQPLLRGLFVDVSVYPDAEKSIRERAGYYYNAYNLALDKGGR